MAAVDVHASVSPGFFRGTAVEWSPNLSGPAQADTSPPLTPYVELKPGTASVVDNAPVSLLPVATITATRARSFADDFYNRILILPNPLDLGFVVNTQQIPVEIFNGYFEAKALEDINATGAEGLTLIGPAPPVSWAPLETKTFQVAVSTEGPATINAQFLLDWTGTADDAALRVIGVRLVGLPYIFQAPCKEVLSWKTDVLTANNGSEQRIRLRKKPRQELSVTYPVPYEELPRVENLLYGWLHRRWAVPLWEEAQYVGQILEGATEIALDTRFVDLREGGLVYLYDGPRSNATLEIATLEAGRLVLSLPTGQGFANAWVMPVRLGRLSGNPNRATNGYAGSVDMEYEFSDNLFIDEGPSAVQFLGYDVYFEEVLMPSSELTDVVQRRIDEVDYGMAAAASFFSPWRFTRIARPHKFLFQGLEDIWTFRRWLHRRAGRLRPFWQPTFENNLRINQEGTLTNSVTVEADDYKSFASDRKHLAFELSDGSWLLRTVVASSNTAPGVTLLGLDSPLNVPASQVSRVCFLGLKRLDTDRVELQWKSNRVVEAQIRMVEIEP